MGLKRKINGYIDNQKLQEAKRQNQAAIKDLGRLLQRAEKTSQGWVFRYIARIAQAHNATAQALEEMERIRQYNRSPELPQALQSVLGDYGITLTDAETRQCLDALAGELQPRR